MKKFRVLVIGLLLFLSACGSDSDVQPAEEQNVEPNKSEAIEPEEAAEPGEQPTEEKEVAESEEPEVKDENKNIEFPEGQVDAISYFGTEESYQRELNGDEGGSIPLDFEGFKVNTTFYLVDFRPNEEYLYQFDEKETVRAIMAITETENTNDFDVDYNGEMTIITDTKEQVSAESGLMSSNPIVGTYYGQVKQQGYSFIPLKDDSAPKSITVIMPGPWKVENGSVDTSTGPMGQEQRFDLQAFSE